MVRNEAGRVFRNGVSGFSNGSFIAGLYRFHITNDKKTSKGRLTMRKGLIQIFVLTLLVVLLGQLLMQFGFSEFVDSNFWSIIVFFLIQSVVIHSFFIYGKSELDLEVPLLVMAVTGIRLLSSLMAVVIFILVGVENATIFVINFFAVYLFYFVFEIISVLSNLRSNSKKG